MNAAKSITISARELEYQGDPLGNEFLFHLTFLDQFHFAQTFQMRLEHGEIYALSQKKLSLQISLDENEKLAHVPISALVMETQKESDKNSFSNFGQNIGVYSIEFRDDIIFPHESIFHLPVELRGHWKNKVAQLNFYFDIQVHWKNAVNLGPGSWLLSDFKSGQRNFEGAQLQNAYFVKANLPGVNLEEANLLWAVIRSGNFSKAHCKGIILRGVEAEQSNFDSAYLEEANLIESNFCNSSFAGANLSFAHINTKFIDSNFRNANFFGARIYGSSFRNADLTNANFRNTNLTYVDFRNAILKGADFTGAQIEHIDYNGAEITDVINLNTPSTDLKPQNPFLNKNDAFINGYDEGQKIGEFYQNGQRFMADAWKSPLEEHFPNATADFAEGFMTGFMEKYSAKHVSEV